MMARFEWNPEKGIFGTREWQRPSSSPPRSVARSLLVALWQRSHHGSLLLFCLMLAR